MVFQASQKIAQKMGVRNARLIPLTTKIRQIFRAIFASMGLKVNPAVSGFRGRWTKKIAPMTKIDIFFNMPLSSVPPLPVHSARWGRVRRNALQAARGHISIGYCILLLYMKYS